MQLVYVGQDIVGLALGLVHHLLRGLAGEDEHGHTAGILRNSYIGIEPVSDGADILIGNTRHVGDNVYHIAVGLADIVRLNTAGGGEQGTDAAAVGQNLIRGHGADPVGIRGDKCRAAAEVVAGTVKLFIHKLGIKALYNHVNIFNVGMAVLVINYIDAIADKLTVEGLCTGEVHARAGVALIEIHTGGHAGGENILRLAGEAKAAQAGYIVRACAGGVICEIDEFSAEARQILHQLYRAVINIVAKIERAVHIKKE